MQSFGESSDFENENEDVEPPPVNGKENEECSDFQMQRTERKRINQRNKRAERNKILQVSKGKMCNGVCCGKLEYQESEKEKGNGNEEMSKLEIGEVNDFSNGNETLQVTIDSGAVDHVIPKGWAPKFEIKSTEASRKGMWYTAANGTKIYNHGAKDIVGKTESGMEAGMRFQVADVTKALGSVKKICQAGNRVVFEEKGSYIEDKKTGAKTRIQEENGRYVMNLYIEGSNNGMDFMGLEHEFL